MTDVFLCVKTKLTLFECKKFKDFIEANDYFLNNYNKKDKNDINIISTMISVNKYIPIFLQKYILEYKLMKLFCTTAIIKK
jgi:hypothetical protein